MIFCKDNANIWCILCFQSLEKCQICGFHWLLKNQKCFSFRRALPPGPLTSGSAPGPPLGADPRYRLAILRSPWGRASRFCELEQPLYIWCITLCLRNSISKSIKYSSCTTEVNSAFHASGVGKLVISPASHWLCVNVLLNNIIFCDFCCFRCASF